MKPFSSLFTILILLNSFNPSFKESYSIHIPTSINLTDSGSFNISIDNNTLSDKESICVSIDDSFILSDSHGKEDITGKVFDTKLVFTNNDTSKTVNYQVDTASAGNWTGNLNLSIELEKQSEPAQLKDGPSILLNLKRLKPTKITFSHDIIEGTATFDLSINGDKSILLYRNGTELTITNMKDEKIKANSNMSTMFKSLTNLTTIENLDYIDMSECTDMNNMFFGCTKLTNIDLSSWDVSNVTNMSNTFAQMTNCTSLGNLSDWDVSNVQTFEKLFYCDFKLNNYGDLGKWNVSNQCNNISYMFALSSFTTGVANTSTFPSTLDLSNWDVSNVSNMSYAFKNAFALQSIDISTWNCNNVTNMDQMFAMEDNANSSCLNNIVGIDNLNVPNASKTNLFMNCDQLSKPSWYE